MLHGFVAPEGHPNGSSDDLVQWAYPAQPSLSAV